MSAQVSLIAGERNLRNFTLNMRRREEAERLSKHSGFGAKSSILKLKLAPHTCFTKTLAIENRISRTWERSKALTCALRLLNIRTRTRWLSATWHLSHCQSLLITKLVNSTMNTSIKSLRGLPKTLIK